MLRCSVSMWYLYLACYYLFTLFVKTDCVGSLELNRPAREFSRHRIVRPVIHHGRTKREISSTKDTNGVHHPEVTMKLDIDGEEYLLDLRLNEDLFADNHVISYQKSGKTVLHRPKKAELDICQYSGTMRGRPGSWAAVSTCRGVRGVIYDGHRMRHIEPAQEKGIRYHHYLYDHVDLSTNSHCGYNGEVSNKTQSFQKHEGVKERIKSRVTRHKRETFGDTEVRGPYNANEQSRYVELVLVADNREFQASGGDVHTVHAQMKDVANIINSVYAPLNIFIALVGVVVWNEHDEIQLEENGDRTLTNFLHYRETKLSHIPNDNAQLLTLQKFADGVMGKAIKGTICTYGFSGGVSRDLSKVVGLAAMTVAHMIGHNFGMEHDTDDCVCPGEKCIMSSSLSSVTPVQWSSCSIRSLSQAFGRGLDYCLRNKPHRLFQSPTCGNGFVEEGEQCDCGLGVEGVIGEGGEADREACRACCTDSCVLRANASCSTGACCDLQTCRPKSAGVVCRAADKECDLPEYCTGHSEFCPADVYKMDSTPCGNTDEAYCVRGACRSHSDQCRLLWGNTGKSSHQKCYSLNVKGTRNGNCGYDKVQGTFKPCAPPDSRCGLLHCQHRNDRLEFGMESVSIISSSYIQHNGTIISCRAAIIDLGLSDVDPGLVPDGAKCGDDKMCMSQRCVTVESVREAISKSETSVCPSDCSGHGVCNSKGHCHCEAGYGPPLCASRPGGSIDSGPLPSIAVRGSQVNV